MRHHSIEEIVTHARRQGITVTELARAVPCERSSIWRWARSGDIRLATYERLCEAAQLPLTTEKANGEAIKARG